MKNTRHLAPLSLGLVLLTIGCGGGGGSTSNTTPVASKVSINATNADKVAKGAMAPAQTMAKTGSAAASMRVAVESGSQTQQSVMQFALAQLQLVQGLHLPVAPVSAAGVSLSGFPITFGCGIYSNTSSLNGGTVNTTNGTMAIDIQDMNGDLQSGIGDVFSIAYNTCTDAATTTNGTMSLTINASNNVTTPSTATPLSESFTMSFSNFSIVYAATSETMAMNGGMTMAYEDNGTTSTATMSGASFSMTSTIDGSFTLKDFSLSNSDTPSTGAYSFGVNMTNYSADLGGDIVIATTTPFSGSGTGNPISGVMVITGANSSSLTITANSNNTVTITVNDGTTGTQPAPSTLTWDQI